MRLSIGSMILCAVITRCAHVFPRQSCPSCLCSWLLLLFSRRTSLRRGLISSLRQMPPRLTDLGYPWHADVRNLGHIAERPGQFVRLLRGSPNDEPAKPRKGTMHCLPMSKSAFTIVVMAKAEHLAHSGSLESTGVAVGLRWMFRTPKNHRKRCLILADAQAILSAIKKGRSSAPSIAREIAHVGALIMAGDVLLRTIYVPCEDKPADEPSRGIMTKRRRRNTAAPVKARF